MLGQVTAVGKAVTRVQVGDYAVFTVRRGCDQCVACRMNRSDLCTTGKYRERGIWSLDGYQTERVVDRQQYVVKIPPNLASAAVLVEPLSIVEKAIDEALRVQCARVPMVAAVPDWPFGRRVLVAGIGPVGLLAAMVLRLRGAEVYGLDIVDSQGIRPRWLEAIGGHYIDGRQVPADRVDDVVGPMELVVEAAGVASLSFNLLDALAVNGVYVLTGIPGGDPLTEIHGASLIRGLVLDNQLMMGSVNAARGHFQLAANDLAQAQLFWGEHVAGLITHRYQPSDFEAAFHGAVAEEIKAVIRWSEP